MHLLRIAAPSGEEIFPCAYLLSQAPVDRDFPRFLFALAYAFRENHVGGNHILKAKVQYLAYAGRRAPSEVEDSAQRRAARIDNGVGVALLEDQRLTVPLAFRHFCERVFETHISDNRS